ncbi:MAG: cupin domain-containing protein [Synechococcaceae cyanobacterium SM1_2_3]|nr:cupin domain-containing protein [Synechococcaceae cyanobacterium SM1_2_3]
MNTTFPNLLGELSPAQFLEEYWQKKPLLVRQAWPEFCDPLTPEELAGLACEEGVEAQLVLEQEDADSEQSRHGPFTDDDFINLPDSHWSLWVRDIEKHAPDLLEWLEPFRFVPDWRSDGVMVNYAMPPSIIKPCVNDDDVFLLQGQGRRRWQIGTQSLTEDDSASANEFIVDQEWLLEPGDLLYLPTGIIHSGMVMETGFSYSFLFHAPGHRELISSFMEFVLEGIDPDARYSDPDLTAPDNPGEISTAALDQVRKLLHSAIALDDETLAIWFGRTVSQPRPGFRAEPESEPYSADELRDYLRMGGPLRPLERNPGSRFHYIAGLDGEMLLFVDGQEFALGPKVAFMAPLLCRHRVLTPTLLREALKQADARQLLLDLLNEGYLVIYEDAEDGSD